MLRSLHVRNLAVLAGGQVELGDGFNVLTGETGAGKSLVVDSLALLGGARADAELVREGTEAMTVTGVFARTPEIGRRLAAAGIELEPGDDELVVRREIGRAGRNRVYLNDQPATLRLLQELAPSLLRIHGQREEMGLADPELQRAWLDRAGGEEGSRLLAETRVRYEAWRELDARIERSTGDDRLRLERTDLLRFQLAELDEVRPEAGEDERLRRERDGLRHRDATLRALGAAHAALVEDEGAAADRLAQARHELAAVAQWDETAAAAIGELDELAARAAECGRRVAARLADFDGEPGRLDALEERLAVLERLLRKYGGTAADLVERRTRMTAELAAIEGDVENLEALEAERAAALAAYREAALRLSVARAAWGAGLAERLERELADLALEGTRFAVACDRAPRAGSPLVLDGTPVDFGPAGFDRVAFLFAPNPGEPLAPIARTASGGELARVSLALQLAARGDEATDSPTLVFDEADVGLGGAQGAALGRKLRRLARGGQILAVTHLAQVASFADRHHKVAKRVRAGRTWAEVTTLDASERVAEVARMISGHKVTAVSLEHAGELLAAAGRETR